MNVNPQIQKLKEITGLPVKPDIYTGADSSYIVYTYSNEQPFLCGDDKVLVDVVTIQVNLYTPPDFNYHKLKHTIRDYLETLGEVESIGSWIDTYVNNKNLEEVKRHTAFVVNITDWR